MRFHRGVVHTQTQKHTAVQYSKPFTHSIEKLFRTSQKLHNLNEKKRRGFIVRGLLIRQMKPGNLGQAKRSARRDSENLGLRNYLRVHLSACLQIIASHHWMHFNDTSIFNEGTCSSDY